MVLVLPSCVPLNKALSLSELHSARLLSEVSTPLLLGTCEDWMKSYDCGLMSESLRAAITKQYRLSSVETTEVHFSQFWRL